MAKKPEDPIKKLQTKIAAEKKKAERKDLHFTGLTEEQLRRKLGKVNSPTIYFQSWAGTVAPGGTVSYNIGIYNPDPITRIWLFVHLFVGPANFVINNGRALATVDPRFPRLTQPDFAGLTLASGATATLSFNVQVPAGIEPSNYLGNSFLFQADWHDKGDYFDRSVFVFEVT
ncbi:MAG: hypothetical protein OES32_02960 [Acidobacteriota bacterium]|nr:hypothetical protein [Acidobacteriota bacterium]